MLLFVYEVGWEVSLSEVGHFSMVFSFGLLSIPKQMRTMGLTIMWN